MCLVSFHREDDDLPPPRVTVRPVSHRSSHHGSHHGSSRVIVARPITPRRSGARISSSSMTTTTLMTTTGTAAAAAAAAPQPSRYIVGPPSAAPATSAPALLPAIKGGAGPARTSAPRIIYAPDLPRPSNDAIIYDASPRASHGSLRSRPSQRGHHSRHGSRGAEDVVLFERSRSRVALGPAEDDLGRRRSRSITYETNPRLSGRVVERQRVVVEEEDGRRREYYSKNAGS